MQICAKCQIRVPCTVGAASKALILCSPEAGLGAEQGASCPKSVEHSVLNHGGSRFPDTLRPMLSLGQSPSSRYNIGQVPCSFCKVVSTCLPHTVDKSGLHHRASHLGLVHPGITSGPVFFEVIVLPCYCYWFSSERWVLLSWVNKTEQPGSAYRKAEGCYVCGGPLLTLAISRLFSW